mgnify:CR=1 FL=1
MRKNNVLVMALVLFFTLNCSLFAGEDENNIDQSGEDIIRAAEREHMERGESPGLVFLGVTGGMGLSQVTKPSDLPNYSAKPYICWQTGVTFTTYINKTFGFKSEIGYVQYNQKRGDYNINSYDKFHSIYYTFAPVLRFSGFLIWAGFGAELILKADFLRNGVRGSYTEIRPPLSLIAGTGYYLKISKRIGLPIGVEFKYIATTVGPYCEGKLWSIMFTLGIHFSL